MNNLFSQSLTRMNTEVFFYSLKKSFSASIQIILNEMVNEGFFLVYGLYVLHGQTVDDHAKYVLEVTLKTLLINAGVLLPQQHWVGPWGYRSYDLRR